MDSNLATAIVTSSGPTLVAIVALVISNKPFDDIGKRIDRVEQTLDTIQSDLKEFFRTLADLD